MVDYRAQPFRFEFVVDGARRVYITDCARLLESGRIEIIEVKNDRRALKDPDYALKLACVPRHLRPPRMVISCGREATALRTDQPLRKRRGDPIEAKDALQPITRSTGLGHHKTRRRAGAARHACRSDRRTTSGGRRSPRQ